VTTTLIATRVAGRRAAPYAALIGALLVSSFALRSVLTPAELLAAVPSSAAILLLLMAFDDERSRRRYALLAAAGALAAVALLVKQSFADALAAGAVAIAASKLTGATWRETAKRAAAFAAGIATTGAALAAWAIATHTSAHAIYFALFGFRLESVSALTNTHFGSRIDRLGIPALESGLVLAVPIALLGIALLRRRPEARAALATWLIAAGAGILLGGSYWPHYLIALASVTAVGAAAAIAARPRMAVTGVAALAAVTVAVGAPTALHDQGETYNRAAVTVGDYIRARAEPGESAYVLYTDANVLYYSGLRAAFPYNWSLMMESIPGAEKALRHALASATGRPTWVVEWQSPHAFGLDPLGVTRRLLTRNYRRVATVCGHPLLLARGARAKPPPPRYPTPAACRTAPTSPV
jgi:hypothetical protein